MQTKERDEYIYTIYLFSEPYFMVLDDESIIDVNLDAGRGGDNGWGGGVMLQHRT